MPFPEETTGGQLTASQPVLSYGQKAVGLNFNPSNDPTVQRIKECYAEIIDIINQIPCGQPSERMRLIKIAITEAQTAQMWAVKAATWQDKE